MGWKGKSVIRFAILIQGNTVKSGIRSGLDQAVTYYEILDKPQHYIFLKCQYGGWEINSLSCKTHKSDIEIKKDLKVRDLYSMMLYSHFEGNTDLGKQDSGLIVNILLYFTSVEGLGKGELGKV